MTRIELGCPGHFIAVQSCRWRRHTQVGNYRISTIGDYWSPYDKKRQTLGGDSDSYYETMVFKTIDSQEPNNEGCGCKKVDDWSELYGKRYATAFEAQLGHEEAVEIFMKKAEAECQPT